MISFDARMRTVHDHLYANANIRLPEDLLGDVAKVIQCLAWAAAAGDGPRLTSDEVPLALTGDRNVVSALGGELRGLFAAYNKAMRRYPRSEACLRLNDPSLAYIVASLHGVDMSDASRDWLGDALEVFRSTAAKRLGGQFFTDQKVTSLAIELVRFDPSTDDLVDICAGTGGFLIAGVRAGQGEVDRKTSKIIGVEVDASLAHLANATLDHLANFPSEAVYNADSLRDPTQWPANLRRTVIPGTHRCLASNPPFGQKITVKDRAVLASFALGHVWARRNARWRQTKRTSPTPPDVLFLERNVQLAVPGEGRVAIVLPYQILSGPMLGYVREWILQHTKVLAIVDLPEETFQPWTGTKTALVVLERRDVALDEWKPEDYPVFMAVSEHIGHDRRGVPIVDEDGRVLSDLGRIARAYSRHLAGADPSSAYRNCFSVSALRFNDENDLRINAAFHRPASVIVRDRLREDRQDGSFDIKTIAEVTKAVFFPGRFKRDYVGDPAQGVQFFSGTNITQLLPTNRKYLSKLDPKLAGLQVKAGWILVTRSGSTGIVSSVPEAWDGLAMSEHVIRIVPDDAKVPGAYIEAFLRSEMGQRLMSQGVFGSVIDQISPEHISKMPIPIPRNEALLKRIAGLQYAANKRRQESIALFGETDRTFQELVGRQFTDLRETPDISTTSENTLHKGEEPA
ncbi:MAG: N-6 DNA methylase [Bifidobacteriaceae bacterium]|jgi:predicted RNA methylase|nr:N-6 DNA methylase [Bifidobacteriaceae bacterium]